jgi:hypothetical protein
MSEACFRLRKVFTLRPACRAAVKQTSLIAPRERVPVAARHQHPALSPEGFPLGSGSARRDSVAPPIPADLLVVDSGPAAIPLEGKRAALSYKQRGVGRGQFGVVATREPSTRNGWQGRGT